MILSIRESIVVFALLLAAMLSIRVIMRSVKPSIPLDSWLKAAVACVVAICLMIFWTPMFIIGGTFGGALGDGINKLLEIPIQYQSVAIIAGVVVGVMFLVVAPVVVLISASEGICLVLCFAFRRYRAI